MLANLNSFDVNTLLSEVGEAAVFVDKNWTARYCNDVYARNLGLTVDEVVGRTPFEYAPTSFRRSIFFETCEYCLVNRAPVSKIGYSTVLSRWLIVRVFPVGDGVFMLANDASESVVKAYNLAQAAVRDSLTGLGNKLAMEQEANQLAQQGQAFSVVLIGIDRFWDVNDSHGYAAGDMALLEVASLLQSMTVDGEVIYRVSGDEFAVLRRAQSGAPAERASAFVRAVKRPMVLNGKRLVLGACAGTVRAPADGADFELLLQRAGLALRSAKKSGRDYVAVFREELELAAKSRSDLESELRAVLDGREFVLMIQPKLSLVNSAVIGGEALIRWAHPERGLLSPAAFLDIAENMGAMAAIDQWVLQQAIAYSAQLRDMGVNLPISINLSVESLADIYLADRVAIALKESNVPANLLEVEIPEGALMRDVSVSSRIVADLHNMGVRISIDDFGTGYSSFAYLAQFNVDALKIDRSFVKDLATSEASRKIVKGIVRLAHSLSLEVIAEGPETDAQVNLLRKMKCDAIQGYVAAKPLTWPQFKQFVADHPAITAPNPFAI